MNAPAVWKRITRPIVELQGAEAPLAPQAQGHSLQGPDRALRRRRSRKPIILFQWTSHGPYHLDRLEALHAARITDLEIVGAATTASTESHAWDRVSSEHVNLYNLVDQTFQKTSAWQRLLPRLSDIRNYKIKYAFLCNHDLIDTLVVAVVLRLLGAKVYLMMDSKFDDKQRWVWRELLKSVFLLPYHGALVSGRRSREYVEFLGMRPDRLFEGYDTVSVARIRALAQALPAPEGTPFALRHFTVVARLVPKKNLLLAIDAYARYRQAAGADARALHICGLGELEEALRADVAGRGLGGIEFRGWLGAETVAQALSTTLALILPSTEEQWALVVSEALAMGLPILCSDNVGARDSLVRTAVNGYVFETDNGEGLAHLMTAMATDEREWRRMAQAASEFSSKGDTCQFVSAVAKVLALDTPGK
jgi:glycosyltransferase involved in cell wall biosynthesis